MSTLSRHDLDDLAADARSAAKGAQKHMSLTLAEVEALIEMARAYLESRDGAK